MKKYLLVPFATLSVFTVLTAYNLEKYSSKNYRTIANVEEKQEVKSDEKSDEKSKEKKDLTSEIIECHKKAYEDLKAETDKKITELKQIVESIQKPESKKEDKKAENEEKLAQKSAEDKQILSVLMHLTKMYEQKQLENHSLMLSQSNMNSQNSMYSQNDFSLSFQMNQLMLENMMMKRHFREQQIFGGIGLGQDFLSSPRSQIIQNDAYDRFNGLPDSRLYQNPYEVAQEFRVMPIMGESFNFMQGELMRQPSSRAFNF